MAQLHHGSDPAFAVNYDQKLRIQRIIGATPFSGDLMMRTGRDIDDAEQLITFLEGLRDELTQFMDVHRRMDVDKQSLESLLDGGADLLAELLGRAKKLDGGADLLAELLDRTKKLRPED